ncbi:MAG TPA: alpha/beta hydrolase [Pyrinomonadaceae bacterium]
MIQNQEINCSPSVANGLWLLLAEIVAFKEEITAKSADYFLRQPLKIDGNIRVPFMGQEELLREYMAPLSKAIGIEIEPVSDTAKFSLIDSLLNDRLSVVLAQFDSTAVSDVSDFDLADKEQIVHSFLNEYTEQQRAQSAEVTRVMNGLERRSTKNESGETLYYYAGGSGERTIVIINAFGQGLAYWTRLIADLVVNHKVIIWLPRGSGYETVGITTSYSVTEHREDLKALLTQERIERAEFLGWCTGPKLIIDYYAAYPDQVASMVFLNATFKDWPGNIDAQTDFEKNLAPLLKMVHDRPQLATPLIESLKNVLLARGADIHDPQSSKELMKLLAVPCADLSEAVVEPLLSQTGVVSYAKQLMDFWNYNVSELFGAISVPVLFITGDCDRIAAPRMAQLAAKAIPTAKYVEVSGGSHYLLYERHELVSRLVELFWAPKVFSYRAQG